PTSGWRSRRGTVGRQGEALPHALGLPAAGAAGRGAQAASLSRPLPRWPARSRSLLLPREQTGTHPTSPAAAAPPHALTCISLTSHLMAASGAGRAPAGGQAGAWAGRTRRGMLRAPAREAAAAAVRARGLGRDEGRRAAPPSRPDTDR
ncbi:unnamed protein product, partial [Rangifer tarandus platyrhynchus]